MVRSHSLASFASIALATPAIAVSMATNGDASSNESAPDIRPVELGRKFKIQVGASGGAYTDRSPHSDAIPSSPLARGDVSSTSPSPWAERAHVVLPRIRGAMRAIASAAAGSSKDPGQNGTSAANLTDSLIDFRDLLGDILAGLRARKHLQSTGDNRKEESAGVRIGSLCGADGKVEFEPFVRAVTSGKAAAEDLDPENPVLDVLVEAEQRPAPGEGQQGSAPDLLLVRDRSFDGNWARLEALSTSSPESEASVAVAFLRGQILPAVVAQISGMSEASHLPKPKSINFRLMPVRSLEQPMEAPVHTAAGWHRDFPLLAAAVADANAGYSDGSIGRHRPSAPRADSVRLFKWHWYATRRRLEFVRKAGGPNTAASDLDNAAVAVLDSMTATGGVVHALGALRLLRAESGAGSDARRGAGASRPEGALGTDVQEQLERLQEDVQRFLSAGPEWAIHAGFEAVDVGRAAEASTAACEDALSDTILYADGDMYHRSGGGDFPRRFLEAYVYVEYT